VVVLGVCGCCGGGSDVLVGCSCCGRAVLWCRLVGFRVGCCGWVLSVVCGLVVVCFVGCLLWCVGCFGV
jgi:hypothetical protein